MWENNIQKQKKILNGFRGGLLENNNTFWRITVPSFLQPSSPYIVNIYLPVNLELQLRRYNLQQHQCESLKPHTELGVTKRKQINYIWQNGKTQL